MDDELPYRTPIDSRQATTQASSTDEQNYDTLAQVRKDLADGIAALYKDFNAFELLQGATTEEAKNDIIRQIEGKQVAYNVLAPLYDTIDSTMRIINEKYKG